MVVQTSTGLAGPADLKVDVPMTDIEKFCRRWHVVELAVFGSALRDDFGSTSDIDLLAVFEPGTTRSLLDHVEMEEELKTIFGRDVDLVTRKSVERSQNWIRRRAILESARTIYAAR
jgi:predicted nucleotidyltransferase